MISSIISSTSFASGFSLYNEVSGANVGDYAARGASGNGDASDVFYNPAALSLLKKRTSMVSVAGIDPDARFTGQETFPNTISANNIEGGNPAAVPSAFYAAPINQKWAYGVGFYVPFGLATDWPIWGGSDSSWSQLRVLSISPALSYKVNANLSIGGALDFQRADGRFDSVVNAGGIILSENEGDSWGYGGHVGLLYQVDKSLRFGLTYQSSVKQTLKGNSVMVLQSTGQVLGSNQNLFADAVDLPAQVTLSAHQNYNDKWAFNTTLSYTQWSLIKSITLNGVAGPGGVTVNVTTPENFRDTWRITFGTEYTYNANWRFRAGIGFDQTPTNDNDRNLRMPDSDRIGVAIGSHYQYSRKLSFDLGYTHIFMDDANINDAHQVVNTQARTVGVVKSRVDLLGLQATWKTV